MRDKLADFLLKQGVLNKEQFEEALSESKLTGESWEVVVVKKGWISDEELARKKGECFSIPYISLATSTVNPQIAHLLPEDIVRSHKAIPVGIKGTQLQVAMVAPLDLALQDRMRLLTGYKISPMIASEKDIDQAISQHFSIREAAKQTLIDMRMEDLKVAEDGKELSIEELRQGVEEVPVVRLVNSIITGAINSKASDIHLEPQDPEMRLRYRVDGVLHDIMAIPKHVEPSVVSRIKLMADMDITERRRPQDGHISIKQDGKDYDLRVSTLLTVNGEKVVMRILDRSSLIMELDKLGLPPKDEAVFKDLVAKPYGMILVTGPTGSGKTTTLYGVLSQLNTVTDNIITVEDPVEYKLDGINQIQINPQSGITFATGLRTILRQDPNVIMVGEIRDVETAEIAIHAALTGHLVFSTLHTNDAPGAITRLIDMGIQPFLISSSVIGVVAQRLIRTICPDCKEAYEPSGEVLRELDLKAGAELYGKTVLPQLYRGRGCQYCYQSGFRGRSGVFEMMRVSDELRRLILANEPAGVIREAAVKEGMSTLKSAGLEKVLQGISTIDEVRRAVYVGE